MNLYNVLSVITKRKSKKKNRCFSSSTKNSKPTSCQDDSSFDTGRSPNGLTCTESVKVESDYSAEVRNIYRKAYNKWLRSRKLRPRQEIYPDEAEPYKWDGYRPNTFKYCLMGAFHLTNETLNMWTHFILGLLLIFKTVSTLASLENPYEQSTVLLWMYSFGYLFVFFSSSTKHLLSCFCIEMNEICSYLEYASIAVFGLTLTISFQYITCPFQCLGFDFGLFPLSYVYAVFVMIVIAVHLTCRSRHPSCPYRYLLRFRPCAAIYAIAGLPCLIRYLSPIHPDEAVGPVVSSDDPEQCYLGNNHASNYLAHLGFFVTAIFFLTTRFPESLFPGELDAFGHSHQWFHICVAIGMFLQHHFTEDALLEGLQLRESKEFDEGELDINLLNIIFPAAILLVLIILFICYTLKQNSPLVKANRTYLNKMK